MRGAPPAERDASGTPDERFLHEAVFYSGEDDFAAQMVPFIRDAVLAGSPIMVAVGHEKTLRLRAELGAQAAGVQFADMDTLGRNPARIISAWHDFVAEHGDDGPPLRGVGEPVGPGRTTCELTECHRHEALLNVAFDAGQGWWLQCPYDVSSLDDDILEQARRTHPVIREGRDPAPSSTFPSPFERDPFQGSLPEPCTPPHELAFDSRAIADVRRQVAALAGAVGLDPLRTSDLVLAASELAANSVVHGGGGGVLRTWREEGAVVCEVRDGGTLRERLVGRIRPASSAVHGRGVWFANELCDLVQMRALPDGTVVRVRVVV